MSGETLIEDCWCMEQQDKNDDFYYRIQPPPHGIPDHPIQEVKLAIRRFSKEDLKPVVMNTSNTLSLQIVPDVEEEAMAN